MGGRRVFLQPSDALEWGKETVMDEKKLKNVAAVIRSYNNPYIMKQVRTLLNHGVGMVVVVTNAALDKGSTRAALAPLQLDSRLAIIEMAEGYTWANALNRALHSIRMAEAFRANAGLPRIEYIFNVSVEAQFSGTHLEKMLLGFESPDVAVVGTTFKGIQDGNEISLGRSYAHPRNTGMMIALDGLNVMCAAFDNWCDDIGGMEDIEFVLRLKAFSGKTSLMLDLRVPLIVGKHHHQPTKEAREQEAMKKIVARMRGFRDRIEDVIKEMRLED